MRDTLTQLPNRRCLVDRLAGEIAHVKRGGGELGLLMIDIDHFKGVNDRLGHARGRPSSRCSGAIAQAGVKAVRASDVFARHGGEGVCRRSRATRGSRRRRPSRSGSGARCAGKLSVDVEGGPIGVDG